ncbi:zinc finger MYND domain-containing protein [Phanerochaete sordida]|uniref:Zinc finger MYND domain-containing protein n=1 Tax=Phanerochaete sordida TaxID=48140 RepID=A0A9P3GCR1_9APHY|nr:zinc finger MYND domain-containing protein [Phanerochaete sordida]
MLERWLELFPEPESSPRALRRLSADAIYARLCRHPESWPRLLCEVCVPDKDEDFVLVGMLFAVLEETIQDAPDAVWRSAWQAGLMLASAVVVRSEFLCGFTREELVSDHAADYVEHVNCVLSVFFICAKRARDGARPDETAQLLHILQDTIVGVFVKLLEIGSPFLISEFIDLEDDDDSTMPFYEVDALFGTLNMLGRLTADLLHEHRTIALADSRIPQIFLIIWIWSTKPSVHSDAVFNLAHLASFPYTSENDPWPAIFRSAAAVDDCCDDEVIVSALLRDFADEAVVDAHLSNVLTLLSLWQNAHLIAAEALPPDVRLASYGLAAARRQLCRGESDTPAGFMFASVAAKIFKSFCTGLPLSARQVPAFLDLFAHYALCRIQGAPDAVLAVPVLIGGIVEWALSALPAPPALLSPKRVAMRTRTLAAWRAVAAELAHREGTEWVRCARLWDAMRVRIGPEDALERSDGMQPAFGLLERCAWSECLCSRHKPAHRMRTCKGCERVVYCGGRCQKSDWEKGGHRTRCRMRATSR